jgi:hypothetical protein
MFYSLKRVSRYYDVDVAIFVDGEVKELFQIVDKGTGQVLNEDKLFARDSRGSRSMIV